jgi:hypothetical protein
MELDDALAGHHDQNHTDKKANHRHDDAEYKQNEKQDGGNVPVPAIAISTTWAIAATIITIAGPIVATVDWITVIARRMVGTTSTTLSTTRVVVAMPTLSIDRTSIPIRFWCTIICSSTAFLLPISWLRPDRVRWSSTGPNTLDAPIWNFQKKLGLCLSMTLLDFNSKPHQRF